MPRSDPATEPCRLANVGIFDRLETIDSPTLAAEARSMDGAAEAEPPANTILSARLERRRTGASSRQLRHDSS